MNDTAIILMQLKYCEQCGGLWLRRKSSQEDLCPRCRCAVARIPQAWRVTTGGKRPCQRVRSWFEARWQPTKGGHARRTRRARAWSGISATRSGR